MVFLMACQNILLWKLKNRGCEMRYYINGKEVSKEDAEKQQKLNDEIMSEENSAKWLEKMKDAKFIVKVGA